MERSQARAQREARYVEEGPAGVNPRRLNTLRGFLGRLVGGPRRAPSRRSLLVRLLHSLARQEEREKQQARAVAVRVGEQGLLHRLRSALRGRR